MSTTGHVGFEGFAPKIEHGPGNPEALKYGKLWAMPAYRVTSPGEHLAQTFLTQAQPKAGSEVLDLGCGTGRGGLLLAIIGGLRVTFVDFVRNALDPDIREMLDAQKQMLRFVKADLEQPLPVAAEYGFCTDVLEHIPPAKVDRTLNNILRAAQHVFFSISTVPDKAGSLIGEDLHLTVESYEWWLGKFTERQCVVHWSQKLDGAGLFYVSAWSSGHEITERGVLNTQEEQVRANVTHNTARGWTQVRPHQESVGVEVMVLGGGPSLAQFEDEIRAKRRQGIAAITLNGAYNWAQERGLGPVNQVIVDARAFNARFVHPVDPASNYFIASQCDPSVFADLPRERTFIWHTSTEMIGDLLGAAYPEGWYAVPGGSTVLLRALPLFAMLGFRHFHLYGCDSCLGPRDAHHAYAQPENDGGLIVPVTVTAEGVTTLDNGTRHLERTPSGRIFYCTPWMVSQASEFVDVVKFLGGEIELEIHGDGLLAHVLAHAAAQVADDGA